MYIFTLPFNMDNEGLTNSEGPGYFLVTVDTTVSGYTYHKESVKLYVCPSTDSTFDDLVTSSFIPADPLPYVTIFNYNAATGGEFVTQGILVIESGDELVPSWVGEGIRYYFGYPTTDSIYIESGLTTITFESGDSYAITALYPGLSDIRLLCVTIDTVNFSFIRGYYVGYDNRTSGNVIKKLDGSRYSYVTPSRIGSVYNTNQAILNNWSDIFDNNTLHYDNPPEQEDPYLPGGESEEGGGEGDFDTFSDEIPVPDLPTVTVDNTGFISLYSPSISQLKSLASYLWASTGLDLDTFKRIFTDPISTILGLTIVPVTPTTSGSSNVVLGNVSTGVSMPRISNQYVQFDCGTLNVNEFWGGYLDYSPYTSLEIYLPFIGTKPLNIDDVMGHTIHVVYNIDLLSGACCAIIESARRVLYQFIGQCSCSVPVTGRDMTNLINGILSVVGAGAGTFVATGGNPGLSGVGAVGALASNVAKSKPKVEKSGSMGSMGGMLGVRCPYLIITRPRQALPAVQNRYTGYPSFITCVLGDLVGYTEVYKVHLGDMPATDAEKAEIETLLMNGVIL